MPHKIKRVIYISLMLIKRWFWKLNGKRVIKALGERYYVTSDTIFPTYRKFPLPKGDCLSEIVRFTDFVQLHSICNLLSKLSNPTIIEVGAHHGAYAVILGKIAQKTAGRVIAIEPNPMSFKKMNDNIALNKLKDVVICEQVAISDTSGPQILLLNDSQSHISNTQTKNDNFCNVDVMTLEKLLKKHNISKVDLLIIDVEGSELPVLRSFPWESAYIENIYCELHPYAWKDFGYNGDEFVAFLKKHNFRAVDMYLYEHTAFEPQAYIGPTIFLRNYDKK